MIYLEIEKTIIIYAITILINSITDTLSKELNASYKINNASLSFSIIILIIVVLEVLINIFMDSIYISYFIKFLFSITLYFINWAMNLAIYVKIKNIRENLDEIGLTNEIRKGIFKVIILLSICLLYSSLGIGKYFWPMIMEKMRKSKNMIISI